MPLDPSIALGVKGIELANPLVQYGQLAQIQQAQNQNALAQYQLESARRQDLAQNALSEAYRQGITPTGEVDTASILRKVAESGAGHLIPDLQAKLLKSQQEKATLAKTKAETEGIDFKQRLAKANKAISDITELNSPEEALASIDDNLAKGNIDATKASMLKNSLAQASSFSNWQKGMLIGILDAKDKIKATAPEPKEVKRADGSIIFLDANPNSPTFQKEIMPAQATGMTPYQKGQLAVSQGHLNVARQRLADETAAGELSPASLELAANIYLQTGTLPPGMGTKVANMRTQIMNKAAEIGTSGGGAAGTAPATPGAASVAAPGAAPATTPAQLASNIISGKQTRAAEQSTLRAFSSGVEARSVRSFNTAIDHLDTMAKLTAALSNNDVRAVNYIANAFAKETGAPAPTNFDSAKSIVGGEVAKALTGSNMALKDREEIRDSISRANSPEQLAGVVNTLQQLMGGQLNSLKLQYETGTNRKDFDTRLTPRAKQVVTSLGGGAAPSAAAGVPTDLSKLSNDELLKQLRK